MGNDGRGEIGARRWLILAVGVLAQAAQATIVNGVAFLIPSLHTEAGLSLAQAGTLAGAPLSVASSLS